MNQTPRTWKVFVHSDGCLRPYPFPFPNPFTITVTELPEGHVVVPESEIEHLRRWKAEMMEVTKELDTQAIGHELGLVLGDNVYSAILPGIRRLKRDVSLWEAVAAQNARNTEYYRDLLDRAAIYLGDDVFTCDDGSVSDSPLRAKIPEMVSALASRASDLQGRIDLAAAKLDGALDDLAGEQPSLDELFEQEAARLVADKVFDFVMHGVAVVPTSEPETLKIEVGGAYLTRGGRVAIVTEAGGDAFYSFTIIDEERGLDSITNTGQVHRRTKCSRDLVSRIPFPECPTELPSPPAGFVYAGHGPLPGCTDRTFNEDVAGYSLLTHGWLDTGMWSGSSEFDRYCVRIGSPVHFAVAKWEKGGLA
mgnify:CR=1 FL=1